MYQFFGAEIFQYWFSIGGVVVSFRLPTQEVGDSIPVSGLSFVRVYRNLSTNL